jgi:basic membrane lipoprotein Med (substrate-binding protein (PBP1-ABC) superfamily)
MKLNKMAMVIALTAISTSAIALTWGTGDVIGPDGKVYQGMSPQNKANLLKASENKGLKVGFSNQFLYVVNEGIVTLMKTSDIVKLDKIERMEFIKNSMKEEISKQIIAVSEKGLVTDLQKRVERSLKGVEEKVDNADFDKEVSRKIEKNQEELKQRLQANEKKIEKRIEEQVKAIDKAVEEAVEEAMSQDPQVIMLLGLIDDLVNDNEEINRQITELQQRIDDPLTMNGPLEQDEVTNLLQTHQYNQTAIDFMQADVDRINNP